MLGPSLAWGARALPSIAIALPALVAARLSLSRLALLTRLSLVLTTRVRLLSSATTAPPTSAATPTTPTAPFPGLALTPGMLAGFTRLGRERRAVRRGVRQFTFVFRALGRASFFRLERFGLEGRLDGRWFERRRGLDQLDGLRGLHRRRFSRRRLIAPATASLGRFIPATVGAMRSRWVLVMGLRLR